MLITFTFLFFNLASSYGKLNQDRILYCVTPKQEHVFGIFDGHNVNGEVAAEVAKASLEEYFHKYSVFDSEKGREEMMNDAFLYAHSAIVSKYEELTKVKWAGQKFTLFNEKNSRVGVYRSKTGFIVQDFGTTAVVAALRRKPINCNPLSPPPLHGDVIAVMNKQELKKLDAKSLLSASANPSAGDMEPPLSPASQATDYNSVQFSSPSAILQADKSSKSGSDKSEKEKEKEKGKGEAKLRKRLFASADETVSPEKKKSSRNKDHVEEGLTRPRRMSADFSEIRHEREKSKEKEQNRRLSGEFDHKPSSRHSRSQRGHGDPLESPRRTKEAREKLPKADKKEKNAEKAKSNPEAEVLIVEGSGNESKGKSDRESSADLNLKSPTAKSDGEVKLNGTDKSEKISKISETEKKASDVERKSGDVKKSNNSDLRSSDFDKRASDGELRASDGEGKKAKRDKDEKKEKSSSSGVTSAAELNKTSDGEEKKENKSPKKAKRPRAAKTTVGHYNTIDVLTSDGDVATAQDLLAMAGRSDDEKNEDPDVVLEAQKAHVHVRRLSIDEASEHRRSKHHKRNRSDGMSEEPPHLPSLDDAANMEPTPANQPAVDKNKTESPWEIILGDVGDSMAFIGRETVDGGLEVIGNLTVRHGVLDPKELHRVLAAGAERAESIYIQPPKNSGFAQNRLAMTRALGHKHFCKYGVIPDPHINAYTLHPRDRFLVLCSDGVSDVLNPSLIVELILQCKHTQTGSMNKLAQVIIKRAMLHWKDISKAMPAAAKIEADNASVIVVDLKRLVS